MQFRVTDAAVRGRHPETLLGAERALVEVDRFTRLARHDKRGDGVKARRNRRHGLGLGRLRDFAAALRGDLAFLGHGPSLPDQRF